MAGTLPLGRALAYIGGGLRRRSAFIFVMAALAAGVISEGVRPATWRRTITAAFRRDLRNATAGALPTVIITAALVGLALGAEGFYWLRAAGEPQLIGTVLVIVLVRELAPLLIGIIVLGRSGTVAVVELADMQRGGQVRALAAQGLDPFRILVLPRAVAFAVATFTLGVVFVAVATTTGYALAWLSGTAQVSFPAFLDRLLAAMQWRDFAVFPAKLLLMGLLVALVACVTGMDASQSDDAASLLPRGFLRGITAVLLCSLLLSLLV